MEITKGSDMKKKSRRVFDGASGNHYLIKSVIYFDLVGVYGAIPDLASLAGEGTDITPERAHAIVANQGGKIGAHFTKIATAGLVSPSIGPGPDQIEVSDIPLEDLAPLVAAILELSGLSREEADRVRPTVADGGSSEPSTTSASATESAPQPS